MKSTKGIFLFVITVALVSSSQMRGAFTVPNANMYLIENAWSVNTAGPGAPSSSPSYYSMTINGKNFLGLRPWELRWDMIKNAMDYSGQKVLELGCCMGLVATCLKRYRDASQATGVDGTDQFLISQGSPYRIKAAQWVAQAFEVDIAFKQTDFNADEYESIIGYDYDVVFCFSLLHWIHEKDRFMRYLSNFSHVVFEGHESDKFEIDRFAKYGFPFYEILGKADRGRTVIHFYK